jgi:hypothetical protein
MGNYDTRYEMRRIVCGVSNSLFAPNDSFLGDDYVDRFIMTAHRGNLPLTVGTSSTICTA